jgi:hypothetical protein
MLRRAIAMVRSPLRGSQPIRGLTDRPKSLADKSATDRSSTDTSVTDRSSTDTSVTDRSSTDTSLTDRSSTDTSLTDKSSTDKSPTEPLRSPAALAGSMRAKKAGSGRIVQIRHDPSYDVAYAAKDTKTGLVVLRHNDSARLRSMCDRLGWQVLEDGDSVAED